jgi:hypothetical protein
MKMMTENLLRLTVLIGLFNLPYIVAFQTQSYPINQLRCDQHTSRDVGRNTVICHESRRDVFSLFVPTTLASIALLTSNIEPSFAVSVSDNNDSDTSDNDADVRARTDNDLTATLYNSDGTVKEGVEAEVKYRDVSFKWDQSDEISIHEDGADTSKSSSTTKSESDTTDTTDSSQYTLSYQIPMRWSDGKDGDPIYFDRSVGLNSKAAKGITIFQAPGKASIDRLQKATTIGVAKALDVPEQFSRLYKADIVSGRTVERGSQKYYEFDMASVSIYNNVCVWKCILEKNIVDRKLLRI